MGKWGSGGNFFSNLQPHGAFCSHYATLPSAFLRSGGEGYQDKQRENYSVKEPKKGLMMVAQYCERTKCH